MQAKSVIQISADTDVNKFRRPVVRRLVAEALKKHNNEIDYREYDKYLDYANAPDHWERAPQAPQGL